MTTVTVYKRKLPKLKLDKIVRLNIGCGPKPEKGFIGIDLRDCGQEIIWDVRDGIPFPDNSVDYIWSSHVIEHFDNDESEDFLREIYRVLKPGGITYHTMPHALDPTAFYFDHKTFWNEERVQTMLGVPGLEGFKIIKNESDYGGEKRSFRQLIFGLQKV